MALLQQEVSEELADEIVQDVHASLGEQGVNDASMVRDAALESISRFIPASASNPEADEGILSLKPTTDGRPRTIALIGPTGVGKTTTVAKLAATFKLKQRRHVGLITLDTYRIAAVDQLRTYAEIIGIPLQVVGSPEELPKALRRCSGCDVILIDTAGRSQRDDPKLEQLASFIRAADPHEVHLVLSSTCTQAVMLDAVERFSRIRTDEIIFTKLDEAVSFGVLLNVARKVNKRLSYLTTGQEVPHHIEPSHPRRVAELVLDGRLEPDGAGVQ
jgi:flagellar biosynthesis protein FlhF